MSAITAVIRGRIAAERLMQDAVVIKRPPLVPATNPDTGEVTPAPTTIYTGIAKIQAGGASGSPESVGEAELTTSQLVLHIPFSVTGVTTDDVCTVTASLLDPDLVGKVFTIRAPMHKSFATARRFSVQELSS